MMIPVFCFSHKVSVSGAVITMAPLTYGAITRLRDPRTTPFAFVAPNAYRGCC